jgi:hypothetical protein
MVMLQVAVNPNGVKFSTEDIWVAQHSQHKYGQNTPANEMLERVVKVSSKDEKLHFFV